MRLGLVADVHNHAAELARALAALNARGVERVVTIGDALDHGGTSPDAAAVAAMLSACGAVGVWGNHDFSLCHGVAEAVPGRHPAVAGFMAGMLPRLELANCHFSHREASVDPHDIEQLWGLSDRPLDLAALANEAFAAVPHRLQFVGHYHRWWAATPAGRVAWDGSGILTFDPAERYFVVVAAACDGWCGVLDTDAGTLEPLSGAGEGGRVA